jgi:hypothetical protein
MMLNLNLVWVLGVVVRRRLFLAARAMRKNSLSSETKQFIGLGG